MQKVIQQHRNVFATIAQRRHFDVHDIQAVIQVLAERLVGDVLDQAAMRRRDDANIDRRQLAIGTDALNLARFEEPQQRGLHPQAHLADFVHEDRAAVRRLEPAALVAMGVGEAALHVAEQLRFEQRIRNAGAIDGDERTARARAATVNEPGDDFLADSALSGDQDLRIASCGVIDFIFDALDCGADSHHRHCGLHMKLDSFTSKMLRHSRGLIPRREAE